MAAPFTPSKKVRFLPQKAIANARGSNNLKIRNPANGRGKTGRGIKKTLNARRGPGGVCRKKPARFLQASQPKSWPARIAWCQFPKLQIVQPALQRALADTRSSATYTGLSIWQFGRLVKKGVFPRPIFLTPGGKAMFRLRDLDAAIDKAARSRRPRRKPRGIVRQRMEAADGPRHSAPSHETRPGR